MEASQLMNAADQLLVWAERQRAVIVVADAVKEIGSLEQAADERKAGLATATAEHEAMLVNVRKAKDDLAALQSQKASELAGHQAACAVIVEKAKADAAAITSSAQVAADNVISSANTSAAAVQAAQQAASSDADRQLAATNEALQEASIALEAARADHNAVTQKIAALKAAAQNVLA